MKKKRVIHILLLLLVIYLAATAVQIYSFGNRDERQKCDVAIILGASASSDGVSPVYMERINHGIMLYNNGFVDHLIVTGGVGEGNDFSDASKAKEYAISKGIPENVILMEESSRITQENLENSKEIMDNHNFDTCIIVSDPLHMKRSMLIAGDYGLNAYSSPTLTSKYRTWKTKLPFLLREEFFYVGYKIYRIFN